MKKLWFLITLLLMAASTGTVSHASSKFHYVAGLEAEGGVVDEFLARIETFRRFKITAVLLEDCWSSCTLYSLLLRDKLVCAEEGVRIHLVFHQFLVRETRTVGENGAPESFWLKLPGPKDIARTWGAYPQVVRTEVLKLSPTGLPEHGKEIGIPARKLGIPLC